MMGETKLAAGPKGKMPIVVPTRQYHSLLNEGYVRVEYRVGIFPVLRSQASQVPSSPAGESSGLKGS
jgi:hypothetical protein